MDSPAGSQNRPTYEVLAEAFAAEGVDHHFLLVGHGQMHWAIALAALPGVRTYTTGHEHAAVVMATGYHFATGKTGVASTTCGPGFTQVMTALTSAVQARVPLVVFTADTPLGARWYNQRVDQRSLTEATGARYIEAHSPRLMRDHVQEAFYYARFERRPVVLSAPYDLLDQPSAAAGPYIASDDLIPDVGPMPPAPADAEKAARALAGARLPLIIAGRGALGPGAPEAIEALAEKTGALLGVTLPARGLFDHNPFSLGVIGGYSTELAKEVLLEADCVVSFGASLTSFTIAGGTLFPKARLIQVDQDPVGYWHGRRAADDYVRADARVGAEAIAALVRSPKAAVRTPELAKAIAERPVDSRPFEIEPGTLDPRAAVAILDRLIPKDWDIVGGTGSNAYFYTHVRGRDPRQFHVIREFGAIGSGLAMAAGVAAARDNGRVVLIDGDGGLLMHIQELDTIRRQGIRLLVVAMNDGGFGAEFHRLRPMGKSEDLVSFGRRDFAAMARGFGLDGDNVTELAQIEPAFRKYDPAGPARIINLHISDRVSMPRLRGKGAGAGHGH
jgi:thiamine pyrophosphate-dependent acetolactate synthase large subunit-like protein